MSGLAPGSGWALGAPGTGLVWLGDSVIAATGDGAVHVHAPSASAPRRCLAHKGAILVLAADPASGRAISAGDDGRIAATSPEGRTDILLEREGAWIDALAVSRGGQIAAGIGRMVVIAPAGGDGGAWRELALPATPAALAFDRAGRRLAVAHYGGVSLVLPGQKAPVPRLLAWKGAHIGVSISPNARFVVSVMHENALHGWRLRDEANMAMSGYPAKPRALDWSPDGTLLASSGAGGAVVWPFSGRDGPMGHAAQLVGARDSLATAVAWHPAAPLLAIGYEDGAVDLCAMGDGMVLRRIAPRGDPIAHLAFSRPGARSVPALAALTRSGHLRRWDEPAPARG